MNYGKNLTGEKKGTFSSLDVTGQLNIDDNGSFLSSGNIVSSGSITALHGAYEDHMQKSLIVRMRLLVMLNSMNIGLV